MTFPFYLPMIKNGNRPLDEMVYLSATNFNHSPQMVYTPLHNFPHRDFLSWGSLPPPPPPHVVRIFLLFLSQDWSPPPPYF